jgi:hypothetical protein
MNALPMKNTRQSKEVVGKMLQRHDLRLFGSTNTDTWKENGVYKDKPQEYK